MTELGRHAWAELADELSMMVITGKLKPGHRLVESELAEQFGISRGPVRTALADLEKRGLAEAYGRRGLVVVQMTPRDVSELYSVRIALEEQAISELAELGPNRPLEELGRHVADLEEAAHSHDRRAATEADLAFHRELCRATGNRRLLRSWEALADQIRLIIDTLQTEEYTVIAPLSADHGQVLDALRAEKPDQASKLLRAHLVNTREAMCGLLERQSSNESDVLDRSAAGPTP